MKSGNADEVLAAWNDTYVISWFEWCPFVRFFLQAGVVNQLLRTCARQSVPCYCHTGAAAIGRARAGALLRI
eukprot:3412306-Amphidinium_carterae.1